MQRDMALNLKNIFSKISKSLSFVFHKTFSSKIYGDMHFIGTYAAGIRRCYDNSHQLVQPACITPMMCKVPKRIHAFKCTQIEDNQFLKLVNHDVMFYVPIFQTRWVHNNDGCK